MYCYLEWALKEGEHVGKRWQRREEEMKGQGVKDRQEEPKKAFVVLPYMKGVTKQLQRAFKQHNIHLFCKIGYTIRNVVVHVKDPLDPKEKCGVVYECKCEEC